MTREQQDKLWNDLSEESKKRVISQYNGDTSGIGSQFDERKKCYERIFGSHNLNPKPLTYEDIEKTIGTIEGYEYSKLGQKERAIHQLLLTAKYLNGDLGIDFSDGDIRLYTLGIDRCDNSIKVIEVKPYYTIATEIVYFEETKLAEQALQILGEETIRLALTTDY